MGEFKLRHDRSEEVRAAFAVDETRLAEVWRLTADGYSPQQIADKLGTQTSNYVNKALRFARAIETGDLPTAPTMIRECASAMKGFRRRHEGVLSNETKSLLDLDVERLVRMTENPEIIELEEEDYQKKSEAVERSNTPGIYVYALPHYLNFPIFEADYESSADRTLMKVGMSESDAIKRFRQQKRVTELPEQPRLLRVYTGEGKMVDFEKQFHSLLSAADHRRNSVKTAGTEWFLTSLKFLDEISKTLGLSTYWSIDDVGDEE